jgi:L-iditol 2-dehydrogenase
MQALALVRYCGLEMQERPLPAVADDEVLVRVMACGICGSDVHGWDGSTGRRKPPIVMGHEAAGLIARLGSRVAGWHEGDRVTFDSTIYCGQCAFCRAGRVNLCDNRRVLGVSCDEYRRDGAFAEFVAVPARILYRLPEALTFEQAAVVEPLSVAFHAVRRSGLGRGESAAVIGAGMIGLLVAQVLRALGAGRVIAVDLDEGRLKLARALGADEVLRAGDCDVPAEIKRITGGGADVSFEAVGVGEAVKSAMLALKKGGRGVLIGNLAPEVVAPIQTAVTRELALFGSYASAGEYPECLELLAGGKVKVGPLISAAAPLAEGPAYFARLHRREPGLLKVLLKP